MVKYELNSFIKSITHNSLVNAYTEFKLKYPNEEPHIRVVCSRQIKRIFNDPKFNYSWRKTIIDEKEQVIQEAPELKKIIMHEQKIEIDKNIPGEEKVKGSKKQREKIIQKNSDNKRLREKIVETRVVVDDVNLDEFSSDYVVDGRIKEYDGRVLIKHGTSILQADVSTLAAIPSTIMYINGIDVDMDYQSVLTKFEEIYDLTEKRKDEMNKLQEELKSLKETFTYKTPNLTNSINEGTSTNDLIKTKDEGNTVNLTRSPLSLWKIARSKVKDLMCRRKWMKEGLLRSTRIISHYENLSVAHYDELKKLEEKISSLYDANKNFMELEHKIKNTLAGNKSIKEICESYFSMQKKLNDLKAQVTPIVIRHTRVPWESWNKEFGFIKSLGRLIKHYDSEYDSPDSDYDYD